ncbi:MAG: hypothetical protein LBI56_02220 [Puniceicoccales bacterium]|jgi:hypothetical protein|nr:hypothetical protein [Puniceicoccales bacterium]
MGLFLESEDLRLQKVDPAEVSFHNLFVGTERIFTFENGTDKYAVLLKEKNLGLNPSVTLEVKVAGIAAEILLDDISHLGQISEKFSTIDLNLFTEEVRRALFQCLFEKEILSFIAKSGMNLQLQNVIFGEGSSNYGNEIGVNIAKNGCRPITFNVKLNADLLAILNSKFEKVPTVNRELADDFPFKWHLEIGQTVLALSDYENLTEYDIVFFDEGSSITTGMYDIKGLDPMSLRGKLDGCNLVVQ